MIWKDIKGWPYQVSEDGRIKSKERKVMSTAGYNKTTPYPKTVSERILKPSKTVNGYLFVTLCKNGVSKSKTIHVIVAAHFIGERPEGLCVLHKDDNKLNNHYSNLEYGSKAKNTQDYYKSIGKRSGFVPISEIPKIIERISNGHKIVTIAKEYGVVRNDIAVLNKIILLTGQELIYNPKGE